MRLPYISMTQTSAKIGLYIKKPVQEIRQPQAELNMRQEWAILEIRREPGKLSIDTSEAQANLDLRGPLRRMMDYAEYGQQKALEAIGRISMDGDLLASIEQRGADPIPEIAFAESGIYQNTEIIAAGSIIGDGIEIQYEPGKTTIDVQARGVRMNPEVKKPILDYRRGQIDGYILQKNSLKIEVIGLNVDQLF